MKAMVVKLALFVAVSVVATGWLFARIGQYAGPAGMFADTHTVTAAFTDATGLIAGDDVRLAGVKVGKVSGLKVERGKAVVKMSIDDRHPLPDGSRFELRWKNLLGQRFVQVEAPDGAKPGGRTISDGAKVGTDRTGAAADLSLLLNNVNPVLARLDTASMNRVMATFAAALDGREQMLRSALDDSSQLVGTLSDRADLIGQSITDFATLMEGIAGHDDEVRTLLDSVASTSQTLASKADDLGVAAGKAGEFTSALSRVLAANDGHLDTVFGQTRQVLDMVVANKATLEKAIKTVPWATAAILRMTSHGDWIQSYTRGVGIVDSYAAEPRIGPDYNDASPDDSEGGETLLGQPRVPVPPLPELDLGIIAINPPPGAPRQSESPVTSLLEPLVRDRSR